MSSTTSSLSLQGKFAIVTGISRGIGAGIALELATRGAKTSAASDERAEELISKIKALDNGSSAIKVRADQGQIESPEQIVEDSIYFRGPYRWVKAITETTVEDFTSVHDLNVRGLFLMTQAVIPHLRARGQIVNIGSLAANIGTAGFSVYAATKCAVAALTRSLAAELGPAGHSINCVNPGVVITELADELPDFIEGQKAVTPMENRSGSIDDIAQIVGFLAEEESRWITRQSISATGGFYMN
ncbi:hypothetical protein MMC29_004463 [Sticta canariensis]|nr:hypothetical protein [Sticta canariensis]